MCRFFAFAACLAFVGVANGQTIIFDNLGPGGPSNINNMLASDRAAFIPIEHVDDIILPVSTLITGVNFTGTYVAGGDDAFVPAALDNFEIRIFNDAGGTPGTLAQSFNVGSNVSRVNSGVTLSVGATTADVFSYSAPINFTFTGGNTFYISILNNTLGDLDTFAVGAVQGPGGNALADFNIAGNFIPVASGAEIDFQLTSTTAVPEPGSGLALIACGCLAFRRRRRVR